MTARRRPDSRRTTPSSRRGSAPRTRSDSRTSAAERAYARRAQRAEEARRASGAGRTARSGSVVGLFAWLRPRLLRSRTSFVLLIMLLLAGGVAATLWLSTQAISTSYRLERLHEQNARLAERVAELQRVVAKRESATWLAEQARSLGMVPAGLPAKLVVQPDGTIRLVGEPHVVTAESASRAPRFPLLSSAPPQAQRQDRDTGSAEGDESTDQETSSAGAGG